MGKLTLKDFGFEEDEEKGYVRTSRSSRQTGGQTSGKIGVDSFGNLASRRQEAEKKRVDRKQLLEQSQQQKTSATKPAVESVQELNEKKGFIKKTGRKKEGDNRNDWQRFQEEFLGIESKGGKKNRQEIQEYYDNLKTGKEKADTAQKAIDFTKVKAYEVLKNRAEVIENMATSEKRTYSISEVYDEDSEIREYIKKHPLATVGDIMNGMGKQEVARK